MNELLLRRVYGGGLLLILVGVLFHAPLTVAFGTVLPDYALVLKAWKELLMVVIAIIALVLVTKNGLWNMVWQSLVLRLSLFYILLHLMLIGLFPQGPLATAAGLMIDLRFIAFFLLMYVYGLVEPKARHWSLRAFAAGAIVVVGFGLLQITVLPDNILTYIGYSKDTISPYGTIDKNPDFVRINSTLRGPNPLGALLVIVLAFVVAWWVKQRDTLSGRKYIATMAAGIGTIAVLFATYSRSAYLGAFAALVALVATSLRHVRRSWIYGAVVAVLVSGIGLVFIQQTDWYANVILHEDPESTVVKKSNDEHLRSLRESYHQVVVNPFGTGIGSTGSASLYNESSVGNVTENGYLFIARECGWLGLAVFITLFGLLLYHLWVQRRDWAAAALFASGIGLAVIGLVLPVWADDTVAIVWWGLAGVVLAHSRR